MVRTAACGLLILLAASLLPASSAVAAPPNRLQGASVDPSAGTTATVFTFSVRYRGDVSSPAVSVTATVAGLQVPLSLVSGTPTDGVYAGTSTLPAGTWMVTFEAIAQSGNNPTATAGPVQVSAPPAPTPVPTTPPPQPPPPPPAPVVTPPTATIPPTAIPTVTSDDASLGEASPTLAAVTGGRPPDDGAAEIGGDGGPWGLLLGLALVAAGGAAAWWMLVGRRHGTTSDVPAQELEPRRWSPETTSAEPTRSAERRPASWELASALDDEPIGTVDIGTDDTERGRRSHHRDDRSDSQDADMHSWGDGVDRRQIRRRIRLSEEDGLG
jgi:hypothetical protein